MTAHDRIADTLSAQKSRRSFIKALAGLGAAAMLVTTAGAALADSPSGTYTVSSNANFRSGPATTYTVLRVISKGATFQISGLQQNGYANVIYDGESGWVLASLVVEAGSAGSPGGDPVISGQAWTSSSVNLRSGPSSSNTVLRVVPAGSKIGTSTTVKNGFRYVTDGIQTGWMADAYITTSYPGQPGADPGSGAGSGTATTMSNVNMREKPTTDSKVLLVIPAGSKISLFGDMTFGFASATYNGTTGWVSMANLDMGYGTGVPIPGSYTTSSNVNMRAQPNTSATIMLVVPAGAKVVPTGEMRDGFAVVTYKGQTGWVSRAFLT